ncbi:MAG: hypothetical protein XXXJIFNMEKO3_01403 [Candidatus Erwinia impunctatus]|nr:hypothetical protein XXXJIFNMEKO_01403 [Culicoides impunctatus]
MRYIIGFLLFWVTLPAMALTLEEARQTGKAGETLTGYLAAISHDPVTLALVDKVNQGRKAEYAALASSNNLTPDEVARIAGSKLTERAAPGEYVRGINGLWQQKPPR